MCIIWLYALCVFLGQAAGQMYTYPARCWRKKRRLHPPLDPQLRLCELRLGNANTTTVRICIHRSMKTLNTPILTHGYAGYPILIHASSYAFMQLSLSIVHPGFAVYLHAACFINSCHMALVSLPLTRSPGSFFPSNQYPPLSVLWL